MEGTTMTVFWTRIMSATLLSGTWFLWRGRKSSFTPLRHKLMNRFQSHSSHADTTAVLYHPDLQKILEARTAQLAHKNS